MKAQADQNGSCVEIAPDVVLDGRLALFHRRDQWLTVADLHFGYELSQRAAGNLFPLWGMQTIEARLLELLADYAPKCLVLLGDLVHNRAGGANLTQLVERLKETCEIILIAGNHDRHLPQVELRADWSQGDFEFHHGHCERANSQRVQIVGHHHPALTIRDGAGLRLKLPALVQTSSCWVMPAFSPWAGGTEWTGTEQATTWLCSPKRILKIASPAAESAACPSGS
jgi:uncharacterized protein